MNTTRFLGVEALYLGSVDYSGSPACFEVSLILCAERANCLKAVDSK